MTDETQTEAQEDYAEAWRPGQGDVITGTLVDVKMIDPGGQGPYPCVTVQTPDGEKAIHAFHTVLRRELARNRPKPGDEISISYLGEKEGGRGTSYHAYRVRGGQGQEFDWDSQLPPEERSSVPIDPAPVPQPVGTARAVRQLQESQERSDAAAKNFGDAPPF